MKGVTVDSVTTDTSAKIHSYNARCCTATVSQNLIVDVHAFLVPLCREKLENLRVFAVACDRKVQVAAHSTVTASNLGFCFCALKN